MTPEAIARAMFLVLAMSAAGVLHVLWLRSASSRRFAWPVDGGIAFRGKRLFGANKRVCGFMVLPPATAASFALLHRLFSVFLPTVADILWPLTHWQYAGLGFACGMAFMLAELPNSFLKRQFGIAPGQTPARGRWLVMLVDRFDSVLGVLLVASVLVPMSFAIWIVVLLAGPVMHAAFSAALYALGLKARAL